jgi:hypothetical protein
MYLSAEQAGGSGSVTVDNCVFAGNVATAHGGALSYHGDGAGDLTVASSTFAGNTATFSGGAILYGSSQEGGAAVTRLVNSILWGNDAPDGSEIAMIGVLGTPLPLQVDHDDIQGGCVASTMIACGANLDVDPQFTNAPAGDLTLLPPSPVVDQGDVTALPPDLADLDGDADTAEPTPLDRLGNARVTGSSVDLGAYEVP